MQHRTWKISICLSLVMVMLLALCAGAVGEELVQTKPIKIYNLANMDRDTKPDNQMVLDEIQRLSGIQLEIITIPSDVFNDKMNIILASGEEFDLITGWDGQHWSALKDRGVLMPLNDLLDEYAPLFKERFGGEDGAGFDPVTDADGVIWAIPRSVFGGPERLTGRLIVIREDWLNTLGMEVPTTMAAFNEYLDAVSATDLNGNGRNDEIPVLGYSLSYLRSVLLPYYTGGIDKYIDDEGKIMPITTHPGYKLMLAQFRDWYEKGYLPKDFVSMKTEQINDSIINNQIGAMLAWQTNHVRPQVELRKTVPDAYYLAIPAFTDTPEGGVPGYERPLDFMHGAKVSKTSTQAPFIMKFLNWIAEDPINSHILSYGLEGVHWEWVDKENGIYRRMPDANTRYDGFYGVQFDLRYETFKLDLSQADEVSLEYEILGQIQESPAFVDNYCRPFDGYVAYTMKDTPAENLSGDGATLIDEGIMKIIMGTIPLDDWDGIVAQYMEIEGNIRSAVWTEQYYAYLGQ